MALKLVRITKAQRLHAMRARALDLLRNGYRQVLLSGTLLTWENEDFCVIRSDREWVPDMSADFTIDVFYRSYKVASFCWNEATTEEIRCISLRRPAEWEHLFHNLKSEKCMPPLASRIFQRG